MSAAIPQEVIDFLAACKQDPLMYVMGAFPWETDISIQKVPLPAKYKTRFPGCNWGPDEWQCEFLDQLGADIKARNFDGHLPVAAIRNCVVSGHGIGKALDMEAMVDTPAGPRRWGSLTAGDKLFGADGAPTGILATQQFLNVPFYRVAFDDGSHMDVSSGHLWNVRGRSHRRNNLSGWATLSTQQLIAAGTHRRNGKQMARQWEIPRNGAAQFPTAEQALHPYFVGLWLGDGTKGEPQFTKPYPEPAERLNHVAGYIISSTLNDSRHRVTGISDLFTDPVFQCGSHERYIPINYKYASVEQRTELFKGLCDSDGEVHASGSIGYSTTSQQLAVDVVWLARSLGYKAALQKAIKHPSYRDAEGSQQAGLPCWRVTINAPSNPFSIHHKAKAWKPSELRYMTRWIDSITPLGDRNGMCVQVAAEDHLYQGEHFLVSHNSTLSAWLTKFILDTRPYSVGTVTANTAPQLRTKTWAEVGKWHNISITKDMFKYTLSSNQMSLVHVDPELAARWKCFAHTCDPGNSESFAGQHSDATSFYIFDEASKIDDLLFDVREGGLKGGEPMVFDFGNGTRNVGRFKENCVGKYRHRHRVWSIDSRQAYRTNKAEIAEEVKEYGEDSDYVRVRIRGLFPRQANHQFISTEHVEAAQLRPIPMPTRTTPFVLGVDVALQGDDSTVIYPRIGNDARSYPPRQFRGLDPEQIAHETAQYAKELRSVGFPMGGVFIDGGGGYGSGVFTHLRQLGVHATLVYPGRGALRPKDYANRITEMWAAMRDALGQLLCIPDSSSRIGKELFEELTEREAQRTLTEQVRLTSKEKMAKSPDIADALALTFAKETVGNMGNAGPQVINLFDEED